MNFHHDENRQMLADMLARLLRDTGAGAVPDHAAPASWSAERWTMLAELGVTAALFGADAGGFGGGGFDIAVVFEQIGRARAVEPLLGHLMAGRVLERSGAAHGVLDAAIGGKRRLSFAHLESDGRYDPSHVATRALADGDGWRLTGNKTAVPQVDAADEVILSARTGAGEDGIALFRVTRDAPGLTLRGYPQIDGGRGGDLTLDGAPAALVAERALPLIEEAVAAGVVALAWEAVGLLDSVKAATVDYLRTRRQFGVPIGRFQALQHRLATVALEIEQARSAAINAAAALDGPRAARERAASAAKYTIGRVGRLTAEEAIQMHGGIGMTWELPLSHDAKRLVMIDHQLGDEDHHLARFAELGRAA